MGVYGWEEGRNGEGDVTLDCGMFLVRAGEESSWS